MKYLLPICILFFFSCKNDVDRSDPDSVTSDSLEVVMPNDTIKGQENDIDLEKQKSIVIKQKSLEDREDERDELQELVITKNYIKDEDFYTIDFRYPHLNEELKASYENFNEYISDYYVDISGVEAQILEDKELICDTVPLKMKRESRKIDYKIYNVNDKLISILFYKENFYSWTLHPTYSFDAVNYDLNRSVFMKYEDFFTTGSEEELRGILNEILLKKISTGEMYYDCWGITEEDFFKYKNNFVLDDTSVEYYFDDCVICPSYTGSYSVKIPLQDLLPVLRRYDVNPLTF